MDDAGLRRDGKVPGRSDWRDLIQFYEYFHGDTARARASHQTGWTGLVALFLDLFGRSTPRPRWRPSGGD